MSLKIVSRFEKRMDLLMSPILPKSQMTEEDIKLHYITPTLEAKWTKERMTMETRIIFKKAMY